MSEEEPETPPVRRPGKAARNERRKAVATAMNALSVALVITALVQPVLARTLEPAAIFVGALLVAFLQAGVYILLGQVED